MNKNINYLLTGLFLALITNISFANSGVYKWEDHNGLTHYSAKPPKDPNQATKVKLQKTAPNFTKTQGGNNGDLKDPKSIEDVDTSSIKINDKQYQQIKDSNCQTAKIRHKQLLNSPRIRMPDTDGNIKILSETERQAEINNAQKAIDEFCD